MVICRAFYLNLSEFYMQMSESRNIYLESQKTNLSKKKEEAGSITGCVPSKIYTELSMFEQHDVGIETDISTNGVE